MSIKSRIMMYLTAASAGVLLTLIANYAGSPWYVRMLGAFTMGLIIAIAWHMKPRKKKNQ